MTRRIGQILRIDNAVSEPSGTDIQKQENIDSLCATIFDLPSYVGAAKFVEVKADVNLIIALANYITRNFPSINRLQLVEAFEFASSGKLYSNGKRINVTTYGKQLNIDTIGQVLAAYKDYRETEISRPKGYIPSSHQLPEPKFVPVTAEWQYNHLRNYVSEYNEMPEFHLWEQIYLLIYTGAKDLSGHKPEFYKAKITEYFIKKKLLVPPVVESKPKKSIKLPK